MPRYRISFYGVPNGSLNAVCKRHCSRTVEAPDVESARLKAYETHEHLLGGADGVKVTEIKLGDPWFEDIGSTS